MEQANGCTHASATGVDQAEVGPGKVWRCDHCGLTYRDRGDSRRAALTLPARRSIESVLLAGLIEWAGESADLDDCRSAAAYVAPLLVAAQ